MRPRLIILLMGTLGSLLALVFLTIIHQPGFASATSATRYVAPGGDCGGASPCYATVQAAVDAANDGDEIKIAQGTYTDIHARGGVTQVVYISKTVTLRGGYATSDWNASDPAAHPTTLDAQGKGRVLYITGYGIAPVLEGLRLTGGTTPDPSSRGGGMYLQSAGGVIRDNVIFANTASVYGAGVYLSGSSVRLVHNTIENNTANIALGSGGGLYVDGGAPMLEDNVIRNNAAEVGGGLSLRNSSARLMSNAITGNTAGLGGGAYLVNCRGMILNSNLIKGNMASKGGGLYVDDSEPTLINNAVIDNQGSYRGAGIYVNSLTAGEQSLVRLLYTTIARNSGGQYGDGSGVYITDKGYGAYSTVLMTNTIIFSHTVGVTVTAGNTATLNATLWHSNGADRGGAGTINHTNDHSGDPKFAADGHHLTAGSAAIDKGVNAGVLVDIDGQMRPAGQGYDLGADEFGASFLRRLYLPLAWRTH